MSRSLIAILLCLAFVTPPLYAEETRMRELRVTDAVGEVKLLSFDNPKVPLPITEDTPLVPGDVVQTGLKSRAELTLDGKSVFKLQAESLLKVERIFEKNTQLNLSQGGILAKVKKAGSLEEGLIIKLPTAVVAIRGTEFAADTKDSVSYVAVYSEGEVVVGGAWGHEHVLLTPNLETRITLSNVPRLPYRILHFRPHRAQMPAIRERAAYWSSHWKPMGPLQRASIRRRLASMQKIPGRGFIHPQQKPVIQPVRKSVKSVKSAKPVKHTKPAKRSH